MFSAISTTWTKLFGRRKPDDAVGRFRETMRPRPRSSRGSPGYAENFRLVRLIMSALRKGGWVGVLVLAGLALSAASLYTTYVGLANFTDTKLVAALSSFGIQATLFGASWLIANDIVSYGSNDRRDDGDVEYTEPNIFHRLVRLPIATIDFSLKHFVKVFVLVASGVASVSFSFVAFYDTVVKPEQRELINMSVARSEIGGMMGDVDRAVVNYRGELLEALKQNESWEAYRNNLDILLGKGETARDRIRQAINQERARLEGVAATARQQVRTLEEKVAQLEADLAARQGQGNTPSTARRSDVSVSTTALDKRIVELETKIRPLEEEISRLTALMAEEEKAGGRREDGTRRKRGRGPEWRRLNRERTAVTSRRESLARDLRRTRAERRRLVASARSEAKAAQDRASRRLAEVGKINAELAQTRGNLAVAQSRRKAADEELFALTGSSQDAAGNVTTGNTNELVNNVRKALATFIGTGTRDSYREMTDGCTTLYDILRRTPETQGDVANLGCDASGFSGAVDQLGTLDKSLAWYRKNCLVDDAFNAAPTVQALVDRGRKCFTGSGLPAKERLAFTEQLDNVERVHGEDSSHFDRTTAALARGDDLAWLAFMIAFAIDCLAFGSAVVGIYSISSPLVRGGHVRDQIDYEDMQIVSFVTHTVYEDDPPDVRASKIFLRYVKTSAVDGVEGTEPQARVDLATVPKEHEVLVHNLLNVAARKSLAGLVKGHLDIYWVHYDLVMDRSGIVGRYEKEYARVNGPRPLGGDGAGTGFAHGSADIGGLWAGRPSAADREWTTSRERGFDGFDPQWASDAPIPDEPSDEAGVAQFARPASGDRSAAGERPASSGDSRGRSTKDSDLDWPHRVRRWGA